MSRAIKFPKVGDVVLVADALAGERGSRNVYLLSTTNEWKYRCNNESGCRVRFNENSEVLDD